MLTPDVYGIIFKFVDVKDRMSILLTCKKWLHIALSKSFPPWENEDGLLHACREGHLEYYKYWSKIAGNRWYPSCFEQCALRFAVDGAPEKNCENHLEIIKILLNDIRVDPTIDEYENAITWNNFKVFKLLLTPKNINPNIEEGRLICLAAANGSLEIVTCLLEDLRVDPTLTSEDGYPAICLASRNGHFNVVKRLLEDTRIDPSVLSDYAIRFATDKGRHEIVKLLLQDKRVDPSAAKNQAIFNACMGGHYKVVELLLQDPRVDPKSDGNISYAVRKGYTKIVRMLLNDKRVIPTFENLKDAFDKKYFKIVDLLLQHPKMIKDEKYLEILKVMEKKKIKEKQMEKFIWIATNTYNKVSEFSIVEKEQWNAFILEEEGDWEDYDEESDNGYRIDTWSWSNETLKNIIAFPGDTPVGALFLNDDPYPIIIESDGDLINADIENITSLQQELQDNFKNWKHIQSTFETMCRKNHPHCLKQYYKKQKD